MASLAARPRGTPSGSVFRILMDPPYPRSIAHRTWSPQNHHFSRETLRFLSKNLHFYINTHGTPQASFNKQAAPYAIQIHCDRSAVKIHFLSVSININHFKCKTIIYDAKFITFNARGVIDFNGNRYQADRVPFYRRCEQPRLWPQGVDWKRNQLVEDISAEIRFVVGGACVARRLSWPGAGDDC